MFVGLLAAAGVALGSILPWISVTAIFIGSVDIKGTEGDGEITLALAVVAAMCAAFRVRVGAALCFAAAGAVGLYDAANINHKLGDVTNDSVGQGMNFNDVARASIGYGLWVLIAAAAVGLIIMVVPRPDE